MALLSLQIPIRGHKDMFRTMTAQQVQALNPGGRSAERGKVGEQASHPLWTASGPWAVSRKRAHEALPDMAGAGQKPAPLLPVAAGRIRC